MADTCTPRSQRKRAFGWLRQPQWGSKAGPPQILRYFVILLRTCRPFPRDGLFLLASFLFCRAPQKFRFIFAWLSANYRHCALACPLCTALAPGTVQGTLSPVSLQFVWSFGCLGAFARPTTATILVLLPPMSKVAARLSQSAMPSGCARQWPWRSCSEARASDCLFAFFYSVLPSDPIGTEA